MSHRCRLMDMSMQDVYYLVDVTPKQGFCMLLVVPPSKVHCCYDEVEVIGSSYPNRGSIEMNFEF